MYIENSIKTGLVKTFDILPISTPLTAIDIQISYFSAVKDLDNFIL